MNKESLLSGPKGIYLCIIMNKESLPSLLSLPVPADDASDVFLGRLVTVARCSVGRDSMAEGLGLMRPVRAEEEGA